jgi:hypothetical protein
LLIGAHSRHKVQLLRGYVDRSGQPIAKVASRTSGNVIDIMDALRARLKNSKPPSSNPAKPLAKKTPKAKSVPETAVSSPDRTTQDRH